MEELQNKFEATYKGMQERRSKHGGKFYYLFFEDRQGKKYKTMAYEKLRNFRYWKPLLVETRGCIVGGLTLVKGNLIDGNSKPVVIRRQNVNQFKMEFDD